MNTNTQKIIRFFDHRFYRIICQDKNIDDHQLIQHYLKKGWLEGLDPSPYFSTTKYSEDYPDILNSKLHPFLHYVLLGKQENRNTQPSHWVQNVFGPQQIENFRTNSFPYDLFDDYITIKNSQLFDEPFYLYTYPDIKNINPLMHFCMHGWRENRKPNQLFECDFVIKNNLDFNSEKNPLAQYIRMGSPRHITISPYGFSNLASAEPPPARKPTEKEWENILPLNKQDTNIDIVIPVYDGLEETLACIYSVLKAQNRTNYRLIVIDDCSPSIKLSKQLKDLSEKGYFELLVNEENLGFVKTVNRGMKLNENSDVILLNSDTEVYDFWIDRLLEHAKDSNVATITPLSNNATICSYPCYLQNNHFYFYDFNEINNSAYRVNKNQSIEVPTGIGFCFYIRRETLNDIGYFDEQAFAKGYGEENDFCMRASDAGWSNIAALDVYVRHHGEVSFGDGASEKQARGLKAVIDKHPRYLSEVNNFISSDPFSDARSLIDADLIKKQYKDRIVLFVSHDFGGGIEKHIQDLTHIFKEQDHLVITLKTQGNELNKVRLEFSEKIPCVNLTSFDICYDADLLTRIFDIFSFRLIHLHSFMGFSSNGRSALFDLIDKADAPYYYTHHDYSALCPRAQFVTPQGRYCEGGKNTDCKSCLRNAPPSTGWIDIEQYVDENKKMLSKSACNICPSQDTYNNLVNLGYAEGTAVKPHIDDIKPLKNKARKKSDKKHIVLIGGIGIHKGFNILESCARDAISRNLPLHFTVVGSIPSQPKELENLTVTGSYNGDKEAAKQIIDICPDIAFFPSIWPETYCYSLSIAFMLNIPPVVFDIGAPAERVRDSAFGATLPYHYTKDVRQINDFFMKTELNALDPNSHHDMLLSNKVSRKPTENFLKEYYSIEI
jgi:GT2 family glycosyltransferase/glycosyltransferase involved in cell wall biosynthesis